MILVTGAGGTIGSLLKEALRSAGETPRLAYHSQEKAEKARREGHDAVQIDFARPDTLPLALEDVDTVFLLGTGIRGQVEAETNMLKAARAAGVKRLVKLSCWGAADASFSIARLHREVERAVEASGIAWTFLRPNGFMQNFVNFMGGSIKAQDAIYQSAGDAKISYIDVRDIARVAAQVLTTTGHAGKAYELSGPQALSFAEYTEILSRTTGRRITYVAISDDAAKAGMLSAGIPDFYADALIDLFRAYRMGAGSGLTSAVADVTGQPPTTFEQFARDHADDFAPVIGETSSSTLPAQQS